MMVTSITKWQQKYKGAKLVMFESCDLRGSVGIMSKLGGGYIVIVDNAYVYEETKSFKQAIEAEKKVWAQKSRTYERGNVDCTNVERNLQSV